MAVAHQDAYLTRPGRPVDGEGERLMTLVSREWVQESKNFAEKVKAAAGRDAQLLEAFARRCDNKRQSNDATATEFEVLDKAGFAAWEAARHLFTAVTDLEVVLNRLSDLSKEQGR